MTPYHHAVSSAKKFGGRWQDYIEIHSWFDASKEYMADFRHRALRHHAQGIFECERIVGKVIYNTEGKPVPVRLIGEQHCIEDLGRVPSIQDWFLCIQPADWMKKAGTTKEFRDSLDGIGGNLDTKAPEALACPQV